MTRNGKIDHLPRTIRQQLNHRLDNGAEGKSVAEWLNLLGDPRPSSKKPPICFDLMPRGLRRRWIKVDEANSPGGASGVFTNRPCCRTAGVATPALDDRIPAELAIFQRPPTYNQRARRPRSGALIQTHCLWGRAPAINSRRSGTASTKAIICAFASSASSTKPTKLPNGYYFDPPPCLQFLLFRR
jgi:hypothetical protein